MQPFGSVQLIKEQNAKLIEEKINELIKSGKYSSISDLKFKNRSKPTSDSLFSFSINS